MPAFALWSNNILCIVCPTGLNPRHCFFPVTTNMWLPLVLIIWCRHRPFQSHVKAAHNAIAQIFKAMGRVVGVVFVTRAVKHQLMIAIHSVIQLLVVSLSICLVILNTKYIHSAVRVSMMLQTAGQTVAGHPLLDLQGEGSRDILGLGRFRSRLCSVSIRSSEDTVRITYAASASPSFLRTSIRLSFVVMFGIYLSSSGLRNVYL